MTSTSMIALNAAATFHRPKALPAPLVEGADYVVERICGGKARLWPSKAAAEAYIKGEIVRFTSAGEPDVIDYDE